MYGIVCCTKSCQVLNWLTCMYVYVYIPQLWMQHKATCQTACLKSLESSWQFNQCKLKLRSNSSSCWIFWWKRAACSNLIPCLLAKSLCATPSNVHKCRIPNVQKNLCKTLPGEALFFKPFACRFLVKIGNWAHRCSAWTASCFLCFLVLGIRYAHITLSQAQGFSLLRGKLNTSQYMWHDSYLCTPAYTYESYEPRDDLRPFPGEQFVHPRITMSKAALSTVGFEKLLQPTAEYKNFKKGSLPGNGMSNIAMFGQPSNFFVFSVFSSACTFENFSEEHHHPGQKGTFRIKPRAVASSASWISATNVLIWLPL